MEQIILFYKYTNINDPEGLRKWQMKICSDFHLKGRVILAHEGINGTLGGNVLFIKKYIDMMQRHPLFQNIDFKDGVGSSVHFPRLSIKVRKEIVTLGKNPINFEKNKGIHKTPTEVHELLEKKPSDLLVFDTRNRCE